MSQATEFLLSVRKAFLQSRLFPPDYITFYVSPTVFKAYEKETRACARVHPDDVHGEPIQTKFFLRHNIRIKEDHELPVLGVRIAESKRDWEDLF